MRRSRSSSAPCAATARSRWIVLHADIDRMRHRPRRLLGVALDVTEHHSALAALREASERAALITRHAGIGTWEADLDGGRSAGTSRCSTCAACRAAPAPLSRDARIALVHPDDVLRVLEARDARSRAALPGAYEFRVRLPDGSYRWLASRSAVVHDESGHARPARRRQLGRDRKQERRAARQQAALAEREIQAKSQFLSRMSHELRTPLNAVLGFTQLLQIDASQAAATSQVAKLGHIRAAGEHLLALINDVLDLSQPRVRRAEAASREPVDARRRSSRRRCRWCEPLGRSSRRRSSRSARAAARAGRSDSAAPGADQPAHQRDQVQPPRRRGACRDAADGAHVRLTVRDTGRGLTRDQLAHLFEPFNRLGIESEGIEGTGIGLTIVKALVEGMDGTVAVSSKHRQGTVFEVALPAHRGVAGPVPLPAEPPVPTAARCERIAGSILYIEDNAVNVMLLEELVKGIPGLEFAAEGTGAQGVARARRWKPDLILVDLQLPDWDGYEVLKRLRKDPETAGITCIALSANAMPDDIARGRAAGFAEYWTKPIDFKLIIAALERMFPATTAPA